MHGRGMRPGPGAGHGRTGADGTGGYDAAAGHHTGSRTCADRGPAVIDRRELRPIAGRRFLMVRLQRGRLDMALPAEGLLGR